MPTTQQSFLLVYWPFLLAGFLIFALPILMLLLSITYTREKEKWSFGRTLIAYWLVIPIAFLTPFVLTLLTSIFFNGTERLASLVVLLVLAFLMMALGVYLSKNLTLGLGYIFGGLLTYIYTLLNKFSVFGSTGVAVATASLLVVIAVFTALRLKPIKVDETLRNWGLGVTLLVLSVFTAFLAANALFPQPNLSSTEGMPAYPQCSPGKVNPQTNQYEEDKECQKQLEEYYKKSEEVVSQRQQQRGVAQKRQAWIAIGFVVVYVIAGFILRRFSGAFNGILLSAVILFVYTVTKQTVFSTLPVKVFVSLLGILLLTALTWQFPILRAKK